MTAPAALEEVLVMIIDLLRTCGQGDRAGWIEERLGVLRSADVTLDALEHARGELHGIVLGMGGLMDLSLKPGPSSGYTVASARTRLDELGDALYEATK